LFQKLVVSFQTTRRYTQWHHDLHVEV